MCTLTVLRITYLIKRVMELLSIAVPLLLVVMIAVDIAKAIMNYDGDFSKLFKKVSTRLIIACALFFVPLTVNIALNAVGRSKGAESSRLACWDEATKENIELLQATKEAENKESVLLVSRDQIDEEIEKKENVAESSGESWQIIDVTVDETMIDYLRKNYTVVSVEKIDDTLTRDTVVGEGVANNISSENPEVIRLAVATAPQIATPAAKLPKGKYNVKIAATSTINKSNSLSPFINGKQLASGVAVKTGACKNASEMCACPTYKGKLDGFYFTLESDTGRSMLTTSKRSSAQSMTRVTVNCSDGTKISTSVNAAYKDRFQGAFERICKLKTTGINGVKINPEKLYISQANVNRLNSARTLCSLHAYGVAIDINYNMKFTVKGKTYMPYANMGTNTRAEYDRYIKALGKEYHINNVNYILWKYAFEPFGFSWGGNWSDDYFDPMHFEVTL